MEALIAIVILMDLVEKLEALNQVILMVVEVVPVLMEEPGVLEEPLDIQEEQAVPL